MIKLKINFPEFSGVLYLPSDFKFMVARNSPLLSALVPLSNYSRATVYGIIVALDDFPVDAFPLAESLMVSGYPQGIVFDSEGVEVVKRGKIEKLGPGSYKVLLSPKGELEGAVDIKEILYGRRSLRAVDFTPLRSLYSTDGINGGPKCYQELYLGGNPEEGLREILFELEGSRPYQYFYSPERKSFEVLERPHKLPKRALVHEINGKYGKRICYKKYITP